MGQVDPVLVQHLSHLRPGRVLDVACGQGRNSLWLCRNGFQVVGVDISDVGIQRAAESASRQNLSLELHRLDLERSESSLPETLGMFDSIIIFNYKPSPRLFEQLPLVLNNGGVILFCTFNIAHHEKTGFPRRFCIDSEQILPPPAGLELIIDPVQEVSGNREIYLFRKKLFRKKLLQKKP